MRLDEVIAELRKLNEPVPKPLRLPTIEEVEAAEAALGVLFHPDYREFLLAASDVVYGTVEPCTVAPGGGHTDLRNVALAAWAAVGLPRSLLPICEDNGDYFCMDAVGRVVFWSHDGRIRPESWPNLADWIKRVWIEES